MFLSLKMIRAQWNGKKFTIQSNYIFPQNLFPLVYLQFVQIHFFLSVDPSFVDMSKYIDFSSDRWLMLLFFIAFLKLLGTFQLHTSFLMNQWFFQFFCNISTSCIFSHFPHFLSRKYHQKVIANGNNFFGKFKKSFDLLKLWFSSHYWPRVQNYAWFDFDGWNGRSSIMCSWVSISL